MNEKKWMSSEATEWMDENLLNPSPRATVRIPTPELPSGTQLPEVYTRAAKHRHRQESASPLSPQNSFSDL